MGAVAEFRYPVSEFGLQSVMETANDVEVTVQRPVSGRDDRFLLRIRNGEQRQLTEAFLEEPGVGDLELLEGAATDRLYLVQWDGFAERLGAFAEHGGVVETMWGGGDGWHVCTLFPSREVIRRTYEHLVEIGCTPRIERLYDLSATETVETVSVGA